MAQPQKIYLDYAATTPVDPVVLRAMGPYFLKKYGNAGSLHSFGQQAIGALDASREIVAKMIGADFREVIFTGSATEANNLVLRGVVGQATNPRIIISSIEHESILETARSLEKDGVDVVYLPVDREGTVDLKKLAMNINKDTVLVSVMYANNEVGTVQPLSKIAKIVEDFKKRNGENKFGYPFFHTDASQAFQFLDCNIAPPSLDFMTLSSHKIYGPKGVGALYMKNQDTRNPGFKSIVTGGGQEFNVRAGTENIPAIVGFAEAAKLLVNSRKLANKRIVGLRDELWRGIKRIYPAAEINGVSSMGPSDADHPRRLPNILNVYFPGLNVQDLLTKFDILGLAASSGSACRARASLSSYVIDALGYPKERARESVRFSLGRPTTKKEIVRALAMIKKRSRA